MKKTKNPDLLQFGRIAIRHEGRWVRAYLAKSDTMDGALLMGSILAVMCQEQPKTFEMFKALMEYVMSTVIKDVSGLDVAEFITQKAPEHEKAGHG